MMEMQYRKGGCQMVEEKLLETIRQGLADELSAAVNYTQVAAGQTNMGLKKQFLNYAMEEMSHAQKLLSLLESWGAEAGKLELSLFQEPDLLINLIEYVAQEESAIFYYEGLEKLHDDEAVKMLCRQVQQEEQRHFKNITAIVNDIKHGDYDYD